jgi:hypothetical protein
MGGSRSETCGVRCVHSVPTPVPSEPKARSKPRMWSGIMSGTQNETRFVRGLLRGVTRFPTVGSCCGGHLPRPPAGLTLDSAAPIDGNPSSSTVSPPQCSPGSRWVPRFSSGLGHRSSSAPDNVWCGVRSTSTLGPCARATSAGVLHLCYPARRCSSRSLPSLCCRLGQPDGCVRERGACTGESLDGTQRAFELNDVSTSVVRLQRSRPSAPAAGEGR